MRTHWCSLTENFLRGQAIRSGTRINCLNIYVQHTQLPGAQLSECNRWQRNNLFVSLNDTAHVLFVSAVINSNQSETWSEILTTVSFWPILAAICCCEDNFLQHFCHQSIEVKWAMPQFDEVCYGLPAAGQYMFNKGTRVQMQSKLSSLLQGGGVNWEASTGRP